MDETQNDAPFVAFYDMHAVTFVPPEDGKEYKIPFNQPTKKKEMVIFGVLTHYHTMTHFDTLKI